MLKVYLVRHGETDWNIEGRLQGWTDTPLNYKGLTQAQLIAGRLLEEEIFGALYSSPLLRAFQTANVIGASLGLTPIPDPRLKERSMGPLEGMTAAEIKQKYPEFHREWQAGQRRIPFPDEEGRDAFQGRLCGFLQELQARQPDGRVIVVTHGGALNMIVATVMQLDMERRFPFWFDNASISILEFGGHMPRVLGLNDICHLRHGSSNPTPEQQAVQDAKSAGQIDWPGSTASESSEAG